MLGDRLHQARLLAGMTKPHLTVYDLLAMPEEQREKVMADAFALAANEEIETFDTYDDIDFNDDAF